VAAVVSKFSSVSERDNAFLALFPHRFDYIYADHPQPGETPHWQTETRHPLSDRLLQQGSQLFGVRFANTTQYALLDIDRHSAYHPQQDVLAISRIMAVLEPLGLVNAVICTSSYSEGLHLYLPFQEPQSCWELAIVLASLLENAGFKLIPGQLELFPNPKPYRVDGKPSLFNAHRLPLQAGSYLVNSDFQPIWSSQQIFVTQWQFAQQQNQLETALLKRILKQAKRKPFRISGKADKFINDLNAEIELGWTGTGQTNHLLGRITMRSFIFHHVLQGGEPLAGKSLVQQIVETARSLPGYQEWCQHQHEIEHRVEEWVRCIENSHYFRYGDRKGKYKTKSENLTVEVAIEQLPTWNQQKREATRERIRLAIADLLEQEKLPAGSTARFQILTRSYNIGGGSLYRNRDLWHPNFLTEECLMELSVEIPPDPPTTLNNPSCDRAGAAPHEYITTSLLSKTGGDNAPALGSSDRAMEISDLLGGNLQQPRIESAQSLRSFLIDLKASSEARYEATQITQAEAEQNRHQAFQAAHVARMQRYLESGDPILMAEATAWLRVYGGDRVPKPDG
jgi:hypothetical protein